MTRAVQFLAAFVLLLAVSNSEAQLAVSTAHPSSPSAEAAAADPDKAAIFRWIDSNVSDMNKLGLEIWNSPELSFREFKTSRALMRYLETNGFTVQKNAGGLATAFLANYGIGKPVIAFWTEEDALSGMSQKIAPIREALVPGGPGYACGHNLIAASTVEAAIAVEKFLQRSGTKGTIRVYGTPAEEAGGGKEYMLEDGLFKDVDVLLGWHPSGVTRTEFEYTKAFTELHAHFKGVASHASVSPDQGRNALHALELMDVSVNYLREQLKEDSKRLPSKYISRSGARCGIECSAK
jgi:aminobenzoyl-glutamate utilization protein B